MKHPGDNGVVQLVGGPIGNLGDITYRAVECLRSADLIACEDTRRSRRLLDHYGIGGIELVSLHDHNERSRSLELAERARAGARIALLSDAGMPTLADPGYRLVRACIDAGVPVEVLPGPSAILSGLAGSGMPTDAFHFGGFLPVKAGKRRAELTRAAERCETSVYFETPHRLVKTLAVLQEIAPERPLCVARELTKKFECYHRGTAAELLEEFLQGPVKGEITLVVQGAGRRRERSAKSGGAAPR